MDLLKTFLHSVLHLDQLLPQWAAEYGIWIYAILFLIIFCETGLVVTPFLPGDSLLFAAGAVAATAPDSLNVHTVVILLISAALIGNSTNYHIGAFLGHRVRNGNRFIKKEYLDRTHSFFETYGTKTIILARFVPIVRTFAPFVAGIGTMTYSKFVRFDVIGATLWVSSLTYAGFALGNVPFVKKNFEVIVLAIVFVSILPALVEFIRAKFAPARTNGVSQKEMAVESEN